MKRRGRLFPVALTALVAAGVIIPATAHAQMTVKPQPPLAIGSQKIEERVGRPAAEPIRKQIETLVLDGLIEDELSEDVKEGAVLALRQAYARHVFEPIWTSDTAHDLYDAVADAFSRGLVVKPATLRAIDELVSERDSDDPAVAARADIELSSAYVRLASQVSGGLHDEGEAVKARRNRPNRALLTETIHMAGDGDVAAALDALEPEHPQYELLKGALKKYRMLAADGGWLAIPDGDLVRPGDRDPRMPALRTRLAKEGYGDIAEPVDGPLDRLDPKLVRSLKAFQERHGLKPDGIVGPNTLEALNESAESKIDRIVDTMFRFRAQGYFGDKHVWANIPSYTAEGWNDGKREISMKTIVGRPDRQTPVFSDEVEYVVTNPRWNVPVSIARRDKLPKLQKDPGYATRGNYSIFERSTGKQVSAYEVDWTDPSSAHRYKLVQGPGEDNALGRLKIIFPNQYSVYMHDTPSRHLFDRAKRAFSSGCVRLERPEEMATWIASNDNELSATKVQENLDSKERVWMGLAEEVPVHITYMTVTVDDDGSVNFWRDIYDRSDDIEMVREMAPLYVPRDRTLTRSKPLNKDRS
ncbi:L,D-transpeptidase family protein [Minwuia sp.]|uniref:L,D-transpeptidase family protein n=1 Tax=Minwuia sp. TaxID=2493630 RepID=UPI003A8E2631